jgi:hypothetical protein
MNQLSREKRPSHDSPDRLSRWPHLEEVDEMLTKQEEEN